MVRGFYRGFLWDLDRLGDGTGIYPGFWLSAVEFFKSEMERSITDGVGAGEFDGANISADVTAPIAVIIAAATIALA